MDEFQKLLSSMYNAGYDDSQILSAMLLQGHNPTQVKSQLGVLKKKSEGLAIKHYNENIAPNLRPTRTQYRQTGKDGTRLVSDSGFLKPDSDSLYSEVDKATYKPVLDENGQVSEYKRESIITVGEPLFGARSAAISALYEPVEFQDGEMMSPEEMMKLDANDRENFIKLVNMVVPQQNVAKELMEEYDSESKLPGSTRAGKKSKDRAIERLFQYRKGWFNDRIKSAVEGKYVKGETPADVERLLLKELPRYGVTDEDMEESYPTQLDEIDFIGQDVSEADIQGRTFELTTKNVGSYINQAFAWLGANTVPRPHDAKLSSDDIYNRVVQQTVSIVERRTEEADLPPRFMSDREQILMGEEPEKVIPELFSVFGSEITGEEGFTFGGMTQEDITEAIGQAPVTLSSMVGGGLAAAGTYAGTRNAGAAANAFAATQSVLMGMQVQSMEYNSTLHDPMFYNYYMGENPVSMEEATEIDDNGDLKLKDGYTKEHDVIRSAGHANVSAGAEIASEFIGNKIMLGGAKLFKATGAATPGYYITRGAEKMGASAVQQRALRYAMGMGVAVPGGAFVEGGEEVLAEFVLCMWW